MMRVFPAVAFLFVVACANQPARLEQARATEAPEGTVSITRTTPARAPTPTATPTPPPPQLCLVTREKGVPPSYVPADLVTIPTDYTVRAGVQLRKEAAGALLRLFAAALNDGHVLLANSGYRSYEDQVEVMRQEIRNYGEAQARRQVAEPGHSEHQLGLAMDVSVPRKRFELDQSFGGEPEGQWLAANAQRFGFVISYPAGKEQVTGYIYEPWHIRYVGEPLAQQIVDSGLTLTEYLPSHGMSGCNT
jgi:LAS superfamily LD-carboxypeptidase LdcB